MIERMFTEMSITELESRIRTVCKEAIASSIEEAIVKKDDTLLTRKEAAYELKVSLPTLHSWTEKGILKAHYLGRKKFYKRAELLNNSEPKTKMNYGR